MYDTIELVWKGVLNIKFLLAMKTSESIPLEKYDNIGNWFVNVLIALSNYLMQWGKINIQIISITF